MITPHKLEHKQNIWLQRTALALNLPPPEAVQLLSLTPQQSFRINTLKVPHKEIVLKNLTSLGWKGEPFDWYPDGYTLNGSKKIISSSRLAKEGAIYIQNAASWLPVLALQPQPGDKILDMCAAPGGKASHILELTRDQAEVWVNDNSRPRLSRMLANLQRLGVHPARSTLYDIRYIAKKLDGQQFDKILLDAPCSGEGLMNYNNPKDFATWSIAHIRRLQALQKRAILQAWHLLRPGGTLIYSTCTMAPEENELVINYALAKQFFTVVNPLLIKLSNQWPTVQAWNHRQLDPAVSNCLRLGPSTHMEAFFVAKLIKNPTYFID